MYYLWGLNSNFVTMKKLLFLLAFLFLLTTVFGQSPWWVGGKLGVNFTTVSGKYGSGFDADHKWITSPLFGAAAMYSFSDLIGISAELNLAKSGAMYNVTFADAEGVGAEGTFKKRYTSIQIPVLARFTFGKTWQFFTYGGFYWSYILGGKYVVKSDYFKESGKIKFGDKPDHYEGDDLYLDKDRYRRMDIGLNIGGGVQRQLGPGMLFLDLRFGLGFLDFNKFPEDVDKPDGYKSFNNRSLSLSAGYIFNLGK